MRTLRPRTGSACSSVVRGTDSTLAQIKVLEEDFVNLVVSNHFTKANYYRLFIPEKIAGDKALYLDADVVVLGPVRELYETALSGHFVAAVEESTGFSRHEELKMDRASRYFNSGVLLINMDKWREHGLKDKVVSFVKENPAAIRYVDQCGLNAVVNGEWLPLHPKFNLQTGFFGAQDGRQESLYAADAVAAAIGDPTIVHFTGSGKPWQFANEHPVRGRYWEYRRRTPFRTYIPEGVNPSSLLRYAARRLGLRRVLRR
jgi:lipopolysaccharide biosynthesis glycosyltransferase